jgi:hypothetical protein
MNEKPGRPFIYYLPPIDWWEGWTTLEGLSRSLEPDEFFDPVVEVATFMLRAAPLFVKAGWEGDGTWRAAPLPVFDEGVQLRSFLVAVKQSNNGSTFVASPKALPWLEGEAP